MDTAYAKGLVTAVRQIIRVNVSMSADANVSAVANVSAEAHKGAIISMNMTAIVTVLRAAKIGK